MSKDVPEEEKKEIPENFRLNPEQRLCPKFDSKSIARFRVASLHTMGFRVVDNCAEDHIM